MARGPSAPLFQPWSRLRRWISGGMAACSSIRSTPVSAFAPSCQGETVEREFPWLDLPLAVDMSTDGRWLLFTDQGQSAGLNYAVALRKTDGTPAVRLGEGV